MNFKNYFLIFFDNLKIVKNSKTENLKKGLVGTKTALLPQVLTDGSPMNQSINLNQKKPWGGRLLFNGR